MVPDFEKLLSLAPLEELSTGDQPRPRNTHEILGEVLELVRGLARHNELQALDLRVQLKEMNRRLNLSSLADQGVGIPLGIPPGGVLLTKRGASFLDETDLKNYLASMNDLKGELLSPLRVKDTPDQKKTN
jgi:hypothetical protein